MQVTEPENIELRIATVLHEQHEEIKQGINVRIPSYSMCYQSDVSNSILNDQLS